MLGMKTYLGWKVDFLQPAGEPAYAGPDSVSWRVFKNPIALGVGGIAAVLLEFADARIRSGVWDHSTFKTDPVGRSKRTGMAAMVGVYGPQSAARRVIQGVTNMHRQVSGETPSGEAYSALDVELLDWVSATATYGFLTAYDRFVAPLSDADKTRFYEEGEAVARLYGVQNPLRSEADFHGMLAKLMPRFEPHPINTEFLDIMKSGRAAKGVPKGLQSAVVNAAVSILPVAVRERLELGADYDLRPKGVVTVKAMGALAERLPLPASPAGQACVRLGLPATFLWKSPEKQASIRHTIQEGRAASLAH
mgnify:CR=1 FL=1|tara:strand:- start:61439 stop:62359 length:921 start_codon:yes stop_codon:yes gene_type:complete